MIELLKKTEEMILMLFPGYRELVKDWEATNRDLSTEIAEKGHYKRKAKRLEKERDELIRRCFKAIHEIEYTRLSQSKKDKIIDILRGLE